MIFFLGLHPESTSSAMVTESTAVTFLEFKKCIRLIFGLNLSKVIFIA